MAMRNAGDRSRVRLVIEGRVQGVFYRASALRYASRFGVTGWVRNRPDGAVEVVAEGERRQIEKMIDWCRQGPPGADVHTIQLTWEDFQGEFPAFRIVR